MNPHQPTRTRRRVAQVAATCIGATTLLSTVAVASPAQAVAAAGRVVQSQRVDIDGDDKRDTVTVRQFGDASSASFRVTVTTATGRTATIDHEPGPLYGQKPLFAAAGLDGERGAELILETATGAHTRWFEVYTWRKGRLAVANDPVSRDRQWFTDAVDPCGYRFYTVRGKRYVDRTLLGRVGIGDRYAGTRTTLEWKSGGWKRVSTKRISATAGSASWKSLWGWHGIGRVSQ